MITCCYGHCKTPTKASITRDVRQDGWDDPLQPELCLRYVSRSCTGSVVRAFPGHAAWGWIAAAGFCSAHGTRVVVLSFAVSRAALHMQVSCEIPGCVVGA